MSRKRRYNVAPRAQAPVQSAETKPAEGLQTDQTESEISLPEVTQTPMSIPPVTPEPEVTVLEPEGEIQSIQRTVVAEANAVLASNRKRDPVVTVMGNGIQRIDF